MQTHREAIEALGFEFNPKTGSWKNADIDGIVIRFTGYTGADRNTVVTSKVGRAVLGNEVPAHVVNNLVAAMLTELR